MASINVKYFIKTRGRIQAKVWNRESGVQERLPAIVCEPFYQLGEKYSRFDAMTPEQVERALIPTAVEIEALYGPPPKGEDAKPLLPMAYLYLYKEFGPWLVTYKGLESRTAKDHLSRLSNFVLRFFFGEVKLEDVTLPPCATFDDWLEKGVRLYEFSTHHAFSKKVKGDRVSASTASAISTTAQYFWEMLRTKRVIPATTPLLPVVTTKYKDRKRKTADEYMSLSVDEQEAYLADVNEELDMSPLPFVISAETAKSFARGRLAAGEADMAVITIAGYFALMRPQEIYALMRRYVVTGLEAEKHDMAKSLAGIKHRQTGAEFLTAYMIKIEVQRDSVGQIKNPKDDSIGVAFIYDEEAFAILAESLNVMKRAVMKERRILKWRSTHLYFSRANDHYGKRWVRGGIRGEGDEHTTIKDLRRAGIRELATKFNFNIENIVLLQKLARHKELGTTQLYMRDPKSMASDPGDDGDIPVPGKTRVPSVVLRKGDKPA